MSCLVLSCFPGLGLLDRAFEEQGWCVVRGPDVIWGGDIKTFSPPSGVWHGVIGGPPCQTFSALANLVRANGYEPRFGNLIPEFERVVAEAQPDWFLMENVPQAPLPVVPGYIVRDLMLNNRWLGAEQQRLRRFSFGTRDGRSLVVDVALFETPLSYETVTTSDGGGGKTYPREVRRDQAVLTATNPVPVRIGGSGKVKVTAPPVVTAAHAGGRNSGKIARYTVEDAAELQGLPRDFLKDAPFTQQGKLKAIANGVALPMGRAVAAAVKRAMGEEP